MGFRSREERSGCVNAIPFLDDERGVASEVIVGASSGKNFLFVQCRLDSRRNCVVRFWRAYILREIGTLWMPCFF